MALFKEIAIIKSYGTDSFVKNFLLLGGVFFLLILSKWNMPIYSEKRSTPLIAPPKILSRLAFGFSEVAADGLWIRSLQDIEYCNIKIADQRCKGESWLYQVYDVASDLSPKFRLVYAIGTLALSIIITDVEGAEKLFDKGLSYFPNDWPMLYRAAYHALYETGNKKKAADYLLRAGRAGAPTWVYSLAGRIYSEEGSLEMAEKLLIEMKETHQKDEIIQRLQAKIDSIKRGSNPPK